MSGDLAYYADEFEGLADEIERALRVAALASAVLDGTDAGGSSADKAREEFNGAMASARAAVDCMREFLVTMQKPAAAE